jgi:nitroreductase
MDFYEVIRNRRSVRQYESRPIPADALTRIWDTVRRAPSACNLQPWQFWVIKTPELLEAMRGLFHAWVFTAPMLIVALGNRETAWKRDGESIHAVDVAIAFEHLVLAAAAEGLGTCWICAFNRAALRQILKVKTEWDIIAVTPLGYPQDPSPRTERKLISEIVREK